MSSREIGREFLDNRADILKGSLAQGASPRNTEDPSILG